MRILEVKRFTENKTETYHVTVGDNEDNSVAEKQYFNGVKVKTKDEKNKFIGTLIERDVTDLYKDVGYNKS